MKRNLLSTFILLFALLLIVLQVNAQSKTATSTSSKNNQTKAVKPLVLSITDNASGERLAAIQPIARYLTKELGIKVIADTVKRDIDLLENIKSNKTDIAFINTFGYVLGVADSLPISLLVLPGKKDGSPSVYKSCIITSSNSKINSLKDLIANAKESTLMFVTPTSASGHLVPRLYFMKLGIPQVETAFKDIVFGNNHYSTIEKLIKGEADAGAVAYNILRSEISSGKVNEKDIKVLWLSDDIPQTPTIVNKNMGKALKAKILQAMLSVHEKDPALFAHIQKHFSAHDATNMIIAKDEHYDSIRNVSGKIEDLTFILNFYMF